MRILKAIKPRRNARTGTAVRGSAGSNEIQGEPEAVGGKTKRGAWQLPVLLSSQAAAQLKAYPRCAPQKRCVIGFTAFSSRPGGVIPPFPCTSRFNSPCTSVRGAMQEKILRLKTSRICRFLIPTSRHNHESASREASKDTLVAQTRALWLPPQICLQYRAG